MTSQGSPLEPGSTVLVLRGPIDPGEVQDLCDRARALLVSCAGDVVDCDVGAIVDPDAVTVDALARLQVTALRVGRRIRFRRACGELQELLVLMGLGEVLPCGPGSGLEPIREPEQGEQARGVQEEADPGDPIA